jgi:hypothetical protein
MVRATTATVARLATSVTPKPVVALPARNIEIAVVVAVDIDVDVCFC